MMASQMTRRDFVSSAAAGAGVLAIAPDTGRTTAATVGLGVPVVISAVGLDGIDRARPVLKGARAAGIGMVVSPVFEGARRDAALLAMVRRRRTLLELADVCVPAEQMPLGLDQTDGRVAVVSHAHGLQWADGNLGLIADFRAAGLRATKLSSGWRNRIADGVHEPTDLGLTRQGRVAIRELNRQGVLIDLASTGRRSGLDAMSLTASPVIFSHAGVLAAHRHPRNLSDEQIRTCAATGGVVGISAIAELVGSGRPRVEDVVRHIEYVASLVGPEAVGIGWELGVTPARRYPTDLLPGQPIRYVEGLEQFGGLAVLVDRLAAAGFDAGSRAAVLGGNFARVLSRSWGG